MDVRCREEGDEGGGGIFVVEPRISNLPLAALFKTSGKFNNLLLVFVASTWNNMIGRCNYYPFFKNNASC